LEWFFTPLLGLLLSNRLLTGILLAVGFIQLLLAITGFQGWQCPINRASGVICPGCGLTTAMALMATGQWTAAMGMHAYAPLFLAILTGMTVAVALPADYRAKLSAAITKVERKTGISAIIIFSMLLYWLLRVFTI
jgi:hypothetical protein